MKKSEKKTHTKLELSLMKILADVCVNTDEDCPREFRTDSLIEALDDGFSILHREGFIK